MIYPPKWIDKWRNDQWISNCTLHRRYSSAFKASVVREALQADKSLCQIAAAYGLQPGQVAQWRDQVVDALAKADKPTEHNKQALYAEIGWLSTRLARLEERVSQFSGQD